MATYVWHKPPKSTQFGNSVYEWKILALCETHTFNREESIGEIGTVSIHVFVIYVDTMRCDYISYVEAPH